VATSGDRIRRRALIHLRPGIGHSGTHGTGLMLTSHEIRELRQLLREQELALQAKRRGAILLRIAGGPAGPGPAAQSSPADAVLDQQDGAGDEAMSQSDDALLAIQAAKARLKDRTYGICIACHNSISFDRLLMLPTALRCLSCQERHESGSADPCGTMH